MGVCEGKMADYLGKNGMKYTSARKAVLECVSGIKGHFDAEELYECLKKGKARVSRASIYRAVPIMLKSGVIREASRGKNGARYEYEAGKGHHDHMECASCGRLVEFHNEEIEKLQDVVSKRYGFVLTGHSLELKGLCRECSKKK